jgi:putative flippase GtrA
MKQLISKYFARYGEIIRYLVVGSCSTILNILLFAVLNAVLSVNYLAANAAAWVVCVAGVFFGDKYVVFRQRQGGLRKMAREAAKFFVFRALSGLLDMLLLYVFVGLLAWDTMIGKGLDLVIIIVFNYVTTKFLVFQKR